MLKSSELKAAMKLKQSYDKPEGQPPIATCSAETCKTCDHWEETKRMEMGYCYIFDKHTHPGHGNKCTAWQGVLKSETPPNARADLPRIKDANRESGCEGDNRG